MESIGQSDDAAIEAIARRHGFSVDAARTMLDAVVRGNGSMAQFSHPEFGGAGQWMRGGMTMVADLFDSRLKSAVDGLCADLANLAASRAEPARGGAAGVQFQSQGGAAQAPGLPGDGRSWATSGAWWPAEFGMPNSSGAQNGARYAYFAGPRRLAIEKEGHLTVYDTGDHQISGVSQQQSGSSRLTFSSQHGPVDVTRLSIVSGAPPKEPTDRAVSPVSASAASTSSVQPPTDIPALIEKLAGLHANGVLTDSEFALKKADLLSRI